MKRKKTWLLAKDQWKETVESRAEAEDEVRWAEAEAVESSSILCRLAA